MLLVGDGTGVLVDDGGGGAAGVVGGAAGVRVAVVDGRLGPRPAPRAGGPLLDLQRAFRNQVSEQPGRCWVGGASGCDQAFIEIELGSLLCYGS